MSYVTKTPSRRALLAGAPAIVLTAGSLPAAFAGPSGDAELLALKQEFDPLFELWRAMTIEQHAAREEFEAKIQEKTGMTRAEGEAGPERHAFLQTLYALAKQRGGEDRPRRLRRRRDVELSRKCLCVPWRAVPC
jgi:hypothetical protein